MDNFSRLPNELIENILQRENIDEITGLCSSNVHFRQHCNKIARDQLNKTYHDDLQLYLTTKQLDNFYICITTYEGETKFKTVKGIDNIISGFTKMIENIKQNMSGNITSDTNIAENYDNLSNPKMINIVLYYNYEDIECLQTMNVIIQGDFKNYSNASKISDKITEVFENL